MKASTLVASLALGITAQAGPLPQVDGLPGSSSLLKPAGKDCGLDPDSASSWNASGAEAYLEDWLATNPDGSTAWLKSLTKKESGGTTAAINCATIDTNTCAMTSAPADCDAYEY